MPILPTTVAETVKMAEIIPATPVQTWRPIGLEPVWIAGVWWQLAGPWLLIWLLISLPFGLIAWPLILLGLLVGMLQMFWRIRQTEKAIETFRQDKFLFDRVWVYGPAALGRYSIWPTGLLFLTRENLRFKPFDEQMDREVNLDLAKLQSASAIYQKLTKNPWQSIDLQTSYGPVFGKVRLCQSQFWERLLGMAISQNFTELEALLPEKQETSK